MPRPSPGPTRPGRSSRTGRPVAPPGAVGAVTSGAVQPPLSFRAWKASSTRSCWWRSPCVGAALARRLGFVAPLVLLVAGLGLSFVPGHPGDPPRAGAGADRHPAAAALRGRAADLGARVPLHPAADPAARGRAGGVHRVRRRLRRCTLLLPEVPLAACIALGAVVAPPDAVSATAIARRIGLPRRVVTILEGESLLNDATALVLLRVAAGALTGAAVGFWEIAGRGGAERRRRPADRHRRRGRSPPGCTRRSSIRCWTTRCRCSPRSSW